MADKLTWIPTYESIANAVYGFKDNRGGFLEIFRELFSTTGADGKLKFPGNGQGDSEYETLDPFSFFSTFNRGSASPGTDKSRSVVIAKILERFGIDAEIPRDYEGVPLQYPGNSWFFEGQHKGASRGDDVRLWELFVAAIDFADDKSPDNRASFIEAYNAVKDHPWIKWNITYALFWIRPNVYPGLDSYNRDYLARNFGIEIKTPPSGEEYLELASKIMEATKVSIPVFSDNAYKANGWWPALEVYAPGITVEQWIEILQNDSLVSENCLNVLARMRKHPEGATCTELAEEFGGSKNLYNSNVSTAAEKIANTIQCAIPDDKDAANSRWWPIICQGRPVPKKRSGSYEWRLRKELQDALDEIDLSGVSLYENEAAQDESIVVENAAAVEYPKNMILYGPPGTGKTYQTMAYAVAICDGLELGDVLAQMSSHEGYEQVARRYGELKAEGRIGFTTFHQSYGYEEFIEGIRPEFDDDAGVLTYPIRQGSFLEFCEHAVAMSVETNEASAIPRYADNPQPRVWKLGLNVRDVNDLYGYCKNNGCLRIGWTDWGPSAYQDSESMSFLNKKAISIFQEEMQKGDFVVIPSDDSSSYSIAVVTSDFEWRDDLEHAKRYRSAKWLGDVSKASVRELNDGKMLTLQTAYELKRISYAGLIELLGLDDEEDTQEEPPAKRAVFIIDEINRGNISKVFGELITLIEETKRKGEREAISAKLPYSGRSFSVPSNVYIIGTMNTADRSIALMDTALRRRFRFVEMMPDYDVLKTIPDIEGIHIADMVKRMNDRIALLYDREHTIGHAYFMSLAENPSMDELASIFQSRILPLLQEYFHADYEKIRLVLADNQKQNAESQFVVEDQAASSVDLFGDPDIAYDDMKSYRVNDAAFSNSESYLGIY